MHTNTSNIIRDVDDDVEIMTNNGDSDGDDDDNCYIDAMQTQKVPVHLLPYLIQ